jgi:sortase A
VVWLRRFERLAWTAGLLLVGVWIAARIHSTLGAKRDLARFEEARKAPPAAHVLPGEDPPDYRLWSPQRIRGYEESLQEKSLAPLAVLRIPKIGLEVAVLDGTDDITLNRAVGRIEGTARPGEHGNLGIAGHRDGFFRGLKDIGCGDTMELETLSGKEIYRVDDIWIVNPEDIQVLDPTPEAALTLVACYPFYFVGSAPKRYIVRAGRQDEARAATASASASTNP